MIKVRSCIACRQKKHKTDLIRFVKSKDGVITLDKNQKLFGRSAYVCNCDECIKKLVDKKLLNRAFKCNIRPEIYENLRIRGDEFGR